MDNFSTHTLAPLIAQRWSPRAFQPAAPIAEADIQAMFEAARWSPSSSNTQPWRYRYATAASPEAFQRLQQLLKPGNEVWAQHASMLVLSYALTYDPHEDRQQAYAAYDLGAANLAFTLQAESMGYKVHQMAGFDQAAARERFGLAEYEQPLVMLAVGRLGDAAQLPDHLQAREQATRQRKPLAEIVQPVAG